MVTVETCSVLWHCDVSEVKITPQLGALTLPQNSNAITSNLRDKTVLSLCKDLLFEMSLFHFHKSLLIWGKNTPTEPSASPVAEGRKKKKRKTRRRRRRRKRILATGALPIPDPCIPYYLIYCLLPSTMHTCPEDQETGQLSIKLYFEFYFYFLLSVLYSSTYYIIMSVLSSLFFSKFISMFVFRLLFKRIL